MDRGLRTKEKNKKEEQHGADKNRGWTRVHEGLTVSVSYKTPAVLLI